MVVHFFAIFYHFSKNDKHPRTTLGAGVQRTIRSCGTYRT